MFGGRGDLVRIKEKVSAVFVEENELVFHNAVAISVTSVGGGRRWGKEQKKGGEAIGREEKGKVDPSGKVKVTYGESKKGKRTKEKREAKRKLQLRSWWLVNEDELS